MKSLLVLALLLLGISTASAQVMPPGYGAWGYGYNAPNAMPYEYYYGPWFGMMGPGMMGGYGYPYGGMMGGYGCH